MSTPITISVSPTNQSIATMNASYTNSSTVNTSNHYSKQNNITQVTATKKIPPAHPLNTDSISNRDIQITNETQQSIQPIDTYTTPESRVILRFLSSFGIRLQDITVEKRGTISGYQIKLLASVNGFAVHLKMKQVDHFSLNELALILKSALLSTLIDNHTSPKLAENILVMVDATRDSYKYAIYLAVDHINISFDNIDNLIHEKFFEKFALSDKNTTRQHSAFHQIKDYFENAINQALINNKVDPFQYARFFNIL